MQSQNIYKQMKFDFQVIHNIFERSTLGQSNISVVLTAVGWTFQFVPVYIFETSTKFKSMIFVGAFIGHINCLQVCCFIINC